MTEDQLKKLFEHHGKITKVVLPPAKRGHESNRIGFVHFADRSCAMKALKNTKKYELDGQVVECSLAKPQSDQKTSGGSSSKSSGFLPGYPPQWVWSGWGCLWCSRSRIWCCRPCTREVLSLCMYSLLKGYEYLQSNARASLWQQPEAQPQSPPLHERNRRGGGRTGGSSSSRGKHSHDSRRYGPY